MQIKTRRSVRLFLSLRVVYKVETRTLQYQEDGQKHAIFLLGLISVRRKGFQVAVRFLSTCATGSVGQD
jgi:hypothetical protein